MNEMIIPLVKEKMDKSIEAYEQRIKTVRAGRANPSSLDGIVVSYYGSMTPLKQLATISVPEATQLLIKPFDKENGTTLDYIDLKVKCIVNNKATTKDEITNIAEITDSEENRKNIRNLKVEI